MSVEENLEIPNCPICGSTHIYRLKVERTYILELITADDLRERPQPVRVTRIFICPIKNEKFQASFVLYQTSRDKIDQVTVEGVVEDEAE